MLAFAASLLLAGCEDEEPRDGAFVELLRLLPDRPEVRANVDMGDVKKAREALGVDALPEAVNGEFNVDGFAECIMALEPPFNRDPRDPQISLAVVPQLLLST
jgi:hypothetical protein